jgi:hypothetical protein
MRIFPALVLLTACTGDEAKPLEEPPELRYCAEVAEVACRNLSSCCTRSTASALLGVEPGNEEACRADLSLRCELATAPHRYFLAQTTVGFDAEAASDCLEALTVVDGCALVSTAVPWEEACEREIWAGLLPEGHECTDDLECLGQLVCDAGHHCARLPEAGEPCHDGRCLPGFSCDETDHCAIVPPPAPGGSACRGDAACASGICPASTCVVGQWTCYDDSDCDDRCSADGRTCLDDADCTVGTCLFSGLLCGEGHPGCGPSDVCQAAVCGSGECEREAVCAPKLVTTDYCTDALEQLPL